MAKLFMLLSAISGFLAVALGAFGAHGLKKHLSPEMFDVYQTAVNYHFTHTLALLACAVLLLHWQKSTAVVVAASAFAIGIVIFSGSLYVLSISGIRWLGAITPIGGVAFMIGWAGLFWAAVKA